MPRLRRLAERAADNSNCGTAMSATIVRGGKVQAVGRNGKGFRFSSIHAELDALRQLRRQKTGPEGSDLHVFRFGANGELRMSKPCRDCFIAAREAGISRIFYHDGDGIQHTIKVSTADESEFYEINHWNDHTIL